MGVSQIFSDFYISTDPNGLPKVGDIYYLPVPEITEYKVLEIKRASPEAHSIIDYQAVQFDDSVHYKENDKLPVALLKIESGSEALLIKSKKRPCVVLAVTTNNVVGLPNSDRLAIKTFSLPSYLVAPMFSCTSPSKVTSFSPTMTARIKALQYPHFAYMKDFNGGESGSILRLDYIFPSKIGVGTQKAVFKVHQEVMQLIQAQSSITLDLETSQEQIDYLELIKETVLDCLPANLA